MGTIRAAKIEGSPRLCRLLGVLSDGRPHSTLSLIREAGICAVNSAVAELRDPINGSLPIDCDKRDGAYYYTLRLKGQTA